jgi:DNA-directed RNA polymerase subunit RPC12/RpoP
MNQFEEKLPYLEAYLNAFRELFKPDVQIALVAYLPGTDQGDMLIADMSLDELAGIVARVKARPENQPVERYGLDDGVGVVGYGYQCPQCAAKNEFVDEDADTLTCSTCRYEVTVARKPTEVPR